MELDRKSFEAWILGPEDLKKPLHMESAWLGWQAAIKRNEPDSELSSVPCARCGRSCTEFTIPNETWNAVIRPDGRERDDEYLCIACWEKALQSYFVLTAAQPAELEMHRADYNAIKAAGFDSPGELLAAYNTLTKLVPQDDISQYTVSCGCGDMFKPDSYNSAFIEIFGECENCRAAKPVASNLDEFIENESDRAAWFVHGHDKVVCVSDLISWMTGHARVPLKLLKEYQSAIEAGQFMGFDEEYEQMQAIIDNEEHK